VLPRALRIAGLVAVLAAVLAGCGGDDSPSSASSTSGSGPEKSSVTIAITAPGSTGNIPLYIAQQKGWFKDEGLDVKLSGLNGGSDAITALVSGSADASTNIYNHALTTAQQGRSVESVLVFTRAPGAAVFVGRKHPEVQSIKDMANLKIGVVSLGGATDLMIRYLFKQAGLDPSKAKLVTVGAGSQAVNALEQGQVDALVTVEPTLTGLIERGAGRVLTDLRKPSESEKLYGGPTPSWSLLVTSKFANENPKTTQALVRASLKGLRYTLDHTPEEIAASLPAEIFYPGDTKATFLKVLAANKEQLSKDGLMPDKGPETSVKQLDASSAGKLGDVDLSKTYDNQFVQGA
jgi:NitT/TauT family transport system substrate-binding protein